MASSKVMAIVLAGGEGKRLMPLTADRAKPAVPFGGVYRLVDFALSNLVNARYLRIVVLTQYKSHSLDRHISSGWRMSTMLGNYIAPVPAQQRVGKRWYLGSADAIFQSLNLVRDERPDIIVVVGADHVYRMDFGQMVEAHLDSGAECTVAAIRQPISLADQFGVIQASDDDKSRISDFLEKPKNPQGLPDAPDQVLASMGNYVFNAKALVDAVTRDADNEGSKHDMGGDIVPDFGPAARPASTTSSTTTCPVPSLATATTGGTSGLSTPTSRPRWTSFQCIRFSTSTTTNGRSTPTSVHGHQRSSCTAGTVGSATQ
jgi:glucose-1-phosphate adenylyltransferase